MTRPLFVVLMVVFAGEIGFAQENTDTTANMPNDVFSRRIGTWNTQATIMPGVWVPDGLESKGVETIDWALGKKFVKGQKQEPGNVESMFLETYMTKTGFFALGTSIPTAHSRVAKWSVGGTHALKR